MMRSANQSGKEQRDGDRHLDAVQRWKTEYVKSLKQTDREFVKRMLEEFEEGEGDEDDKR